MSKKSKSTPCSIGCTNVSTELTEQQVRSVFEKYGQIVSVTFPTNKLTGERFDICHITYADTDSAIKAYLELDGDFMGTENPMKIRFHDANHEDAAERGALGLQAFRRQKHF